MCRAAQICDEAVLADCLQNQDRRQSYVVLNALGCVKWVQTADLGTMDFKVAACCEECVESHRSATCFVRGGEPS